MLAQLRGERRKGVFSNKTNEIVACNTKQKGNQKQQNSKRSNQMNRKLTYFNK